MDRNLGFATKLNNISMLVFLHTVSYKILFVELFWINQLFEIYSKINFIERIKSMQGKLRN
jgi:hypothetical protein